MNPIPLSKEAAAATAKRPLTVYRWRLLGLSLSMLLSSLGTSIANVALPSLAQAFEVPFQDVQWVVLAYLLVITSLIVSLGRLGDIVGRRRLLLVGVAVFTLASTLCGFAPTFGLLLAARALQGLGAAIMMALTLAFVAEVAPRAKTGAAMGLLGTMSAVGTALGPTLGGVLLACLGWRAIFLICLPLGLLAFFLVLRWLPPAPSIGLQEAKRERPCFDSLGTLLLATSLAAYALAMTMGRGRFGLLNGVLLGAAVLGLGLFLFTQTRASSPLIRLALFRDRGLSAGFAMSALVTTVVMATLVVGPFYLKSAFGLAAAQVGLLMSCGPAVAALTSAPAGRAVDRLGSHRMTRFGLTAMLIGSALMALLPRSLGVLGYVVPLLLITAGYALFQTANNTAVMVDVGAEQRGVVSGLLNLSRNLGLITGASAMGAVFAFGAASRNISTAAPEAVAAGLQLTFLVAAVLIVAAILISLTTGGRASAPSSMQPRNSP